MEKKKIAVVTGAARGIGAAISRRLVSDGYGIVAVDIDNIGLQALKADIDATFGDDCFQILTADIASPANCHELTSRIEETCGGCDILVNNAGIARDHLAIRMSDQDWLDVISVNLNAGFFLARDFFRGMMKRRWGRIISISSVVATIGNVGQANYAAAKAGLLGMTRSLAREGAARNITVNAISPGFIETGMTALLSDEQRKTLLEMIPLKRYGIPEDIAHAVSFLVSEDAGYITGQVLNINGGLFM